MFLQSTSFSKDASAGGAVIALAMAASGRLAFAVGVHAALVISLLACKLTPHGEKSLVPGAGLITDSPHGSYWQIPATSLDEVEKQKPGPKPAKKSKKGTE
jgi:hypothetical protein